MFCSGLELGSFLVSSDILHHSWSMIVELQNEIGSKDPDSPISVNHRVYQHEEIGTIIVFISSPPCTPQHFQGGGGDLVSSEILKTSFPVFDFIATKVNPSFSINKAAVDLFASIQSELSSLNQYIDVRPLIITGQSIGGSIASLFTLWVLENMSLKAGNRPLCITFGAPFLGDDGFQRAILERPMWNSTFFHTVYSRDPIPHLFISPRNMSQLSFLASTYNSYKPFGSSLLCSESGFAFLEEPKSVLDTMLANNMESVKDFGTNEQLQVNDYGNVLEKLKHGLLCRGISKLGVCDYSPLCTGVKLQLEAIKCERTKPQLVNANSDYTMENIETRIKSLSATQRHMFEPKKKLHDMKINMVYLEWYKKISVSNGGYYNSFKNNQSKSREQIVKKKNILTQYWIRMVKEVEKIPKKEDAFFGMAWLYGGTHYRRMVEPLDVAEWYKKGKTDYVSTRSDHYKLLEKWVKDDQSNANERYRACYLTEDSCFWAHVEEAVVSCKLLSDIGGSSIANRRTLLENLVEFENYVMGVIKTYAVSTEIFLKQSSFMKWWEDYDKIRGNSYRSGVTDFMRSRKYEEYS